MQPAALNSRTRMTSALTAILFFGIAGPTWPVDNILTRISLKGVTAVAVLVEPMTPDAERDGLTKDQLQTDIELRLRKAGINVASLPLPETGWAYLYLSVHARKYPEVQTYSVALSLQFRQWVILERDPGVRAPATTWGTSSSGLMGSRVIRNLVRDGVADAVDKFINAYLEQNPKP